MENIDKIYLYVTSPIKKIIGEVGVLEKYFMKKEHLWEVTHEKAGITEEFFEKYFKNQNWAGAYKLGKVIQYEVPIELKEMGINYVPQSYAYVKTRKM